MDELSGADSNTDGLSGRLRLFMAVAFSSEVKERGSRLIQRLEIGARFTGAHPAWVKFDSVHLTLVFLGWQPTESLATLIRVMDSAASRQEPFRISLGGLALFPTPKAPSVLSLGIHGDIDALKHLQGMLSEDSRSAGFDVDSREFRPHVTLARIKSMKGLTGLRDLVASHRPEGAGSMDVDRITLYRSHLKPDGAEYEVIHQSLLTGDSGPSA